MSTIGNRWAFSWAIYVNVPILCRFFITNIWSRLLFFSLMCNTYACSDSYISKQKYHINCQIWSPNNYLISHSTNKSTFALRSFVTQPHYLSNSYRTISIASYTTSQWTCTLFMYLLFRFVLFGIYQLVNCTASNGRFFLRHWPLCEWLIGHRRTPLAITLIWYFVDVGSRKLLNKQSNDWWFGTTWLSCDIIAMVKPQ